MPDLNVRALRPADSPLLGDVVVGPSPILTFRRTDDHCGQTWAECLRLARDGFPTGSAPGLRLDALLDAGTPITRETITGLLGEDGELDEMLRLIGADRISVSHTLGRCRCVTTAATDAIRAAELVIADRFAYDWTIVVQRQGAGGRPVVAFLDIAGKVTVRDALISKHLSAPDHLGELDVFEGPDVLHFRLADAGDVDEFSVWRLPSRLDHFVVKALSFHLGDLEFLPALLRLTPHQAQLATLINVPERDDALFGVNDPQSALEQLRHQCSSVDDHTVELAGKLAGTWSGDITALLNAARDLH